MDPGQHEIPQNLAFRNAMIKCRDQWFEESKNKYGVPDIHRLRMAAMIICRDHWLGESKDKYGTPYSQRSSTVSDPHSLQKSDLASRKEQGSMTNKEGPGLRRTRDKGCDLGVCNVGKRISHVSL